MKKQENKSEIYILSGFLGSGKTTLLGNLLAEEKKLGRKVAVMMNELGKVSIDSMIIGDDIPLTELLDGCICCTIQDKLEAQLQGLLLDQKPEVIYIETTGAAHPVEVLDAVLSPLFADQLNVRGIISVVDGKRWLSRKTLSPQVQQLLIEQVRHADLVLINKADVLTEGEQAQASIEIQSINPAVFSILTTNAKVSLNQIRKITLRTKESKRDTHVKKDLNLSTFVYQFKNPVKQSDFEDFVRSLPDTVFRMKGYVKFNQSDYPYLFQFSYGMPLYMKEYMNMPLNMVFIGIDLNIDKIERELKELDNIY